jgi:hypothetical protein
MPLFRMHDVYPNKPHKNAPNPTNTTIVVSRWQASTRWTQRLVELGYRVCVYDHGTNPNNPYNLPRNCGREASAYLKYIRDHYDALTTYTIFTHDEEYSWHHDGSLVDLISRKLSTIPETIKFINFNNRCTDSIKNDLWPTMKGYFDKYLAPYIGSRNQYGDWTIGNRCCAQFIVHRDRIRRHPRKFYEDLYRYHITPTKDDPIGYAKGHLFEWTISLIFGRGVRNRFAGPTPVLTNIQGSNKQRTNKPGCPILPSNHHKTNNKKRAYQQPYSIPLGNVA